MSSKATGVRNSQFEAILGELGLSRNEARIFGALLQNGEQTIARIATTTRVNRRNVYDALHRLLEKGLVFEIVESHSRSFKPVDPNKLLELVHEQELTLRAALPGMRELQSSVVERQEAFIYRGIEGWKNYMRDVLRIGEPVCVIGGKGTWLDERLKNFLPWFLDEARKRNIITRHLFDAEVVSACPEILEVIERKHYKILQARYSTRATVDVFGDHVTLASPLQAGALGAAPCMTVVVDKRLAHSFRLWFDYMWKFLPS